MTQIYDAAIRLSLIETGVLSGISAIVAQFARGTGEVAKFEKALGNLKVAAWGVAGAFAGIEALKFASHVEKAGEHLVHVKTMFEAALPAATRLADMTKITSAALKESGDNLRTGLSGNIEAIHDLYNIVGDVGEATKLLPAFNVLKNMLDSVADKGSLGDAASNANVAKAVRAFEFMGRADPAHPELLARTMGQYRKTLIGQRGRVTGGDLFTQTQTAGDAAKGWSDLFATTIFPEMILLGGKRVGFGAYQTFNNLWGGGGGNLSSFTQAMGQEKWGLHTKKDEIRDEKGKFKGFHAGSVWEASKLRENPLEWANAYRALLQTKYGVNIEDMTSMQLVISDIARNNKNMKSYLDELLLPSTSRQLNKGVAVYGKIPDDAAGIINANDPRAWRQALSAQWETLQEVFGEGYVYPFINKVLKPLAETLNAISRWGSANPALMKNIADGFVIFSGALVGGGGIAMLAALGPTGWLAAGVIAAGAAIALYKNPIMTWLENIRTTNWNEEITKALEPAIKALKDWFKNLGAAIMDSLSGMWNDMKRALHLISFSGGEGGGGGIIKTSYGGAAIGGGLTYGDVGGSGAGGFNVRGVHNMNLGNIGFGPWARAHGAVGSAGMDTGHGVAVFPSFAAGLNAASALALSKYHAGRRTALALIAGAGGWTPGNRGAAANIARAMGLGIGDDLHLDDPAHMSSFLRGLGRQELGPRGAGEYFKHVTPHKNEETVIHNHIYMDGKIIAKSTSKHFVRAAQYPTSVGRQDGRGTFMGPGAEVFA